MDAIYLDIHTVIGIVLENPSEPVKNFLLAQLGHFQLNANRKKNGSADIVIKQLAGNMPDLPAADLWHDLYGFTFLNFKGRDAVCFQYKAGCDIIVSFEDTIVIYYLPRPGVQRKLYSILLYLITLVLNKKQGCLVHGAVVKRGNCCVMLAGHRGTMKTILVLSFLKQGWDFISDDKCIMIDGSVYMFQPFIPVRAHHYEALPWLETDTDITLNRFPYIRKSAVVIANRFLPKRGVQSLNRFLNPSTRIPGDSISSSSRIIDHARLSDIVILDTNESMGMSKLTKEKLVNKFALIQKMANHEFGLIDAMIRLKSTAHYYPPKTIFEKNMDAKNFFQFSFPGQSDINQVFLELTRCLQQQ